MNSIGSKNTLPLDGNTIRSGPAVNVTAHLDATEGVVEPFLAARLDEFEKIKSEAGDNIEITADIYRGGITPAEKIKKGLKKLALHVALPVAGAFLGGPVGLGIGLLVDAGMFALGETRGALGNLLSGIEHRKTLNEPDWAGRRTYEISADQTPGFDSKMVLREDDRSKVSDTEFGMTLSKNLGKYPSVRTEIVFLGGHGLGYRSVAGMKVHEMAEALQQAESSTGKKPDIIIAESCLEGNIEGLTSLAGRAKVAVLSEETLNVSALPLNEMFGDAARGGTAAEIGKRMVDTAARADKIQTLAAIDLEKIGALNNELSALAKGLIGDIAKGRQHEIQEAVKGAMKFPQGKMMFLERKLLNLSDLGGFLKALGKTGIAPETKDLAKKAMEALNESTLALATSKEYSEASGISFQAKPRSAILDSNKDMATYEETDMPKPWKAFINLLWADISTPRGLAAALGTIKKDIS